MSDVENARRFAEAAANAAGDGVLRPADAPAPRTSPAGAVDGAPAPEPQAAAPAEAATGEPAVAAALAAHEFATGRRKSLPRRLLANRAVVAGGAVFLLIVLVALVGPYVWQVSPTTQEMASRLSAPSAAHPLGTDDFGRDLLARVISGARVSLGVGAAVTLATSVLGLLIGAYACYNRVLDQILMRVCDGLMSIPAVLLAIALMAMLGSSVWNVILALTIVYTPSMARIVRSRAMVVKEEPFVEALRVQGASTARIVWLHVVPNVMAPFLVQATFIFAEAVLSEAALSFLGLGVTAPDASWGNILQAGKSVIRKAWWMIAFPALAIIASVLSLNLAGDGLRDVLDPRSKGGE